MDGKMSIKTKPTVYTCFLCLLMITVAQAQPKIPQSPKQATHLKVNNKPLNRVDSLIYTSIRDHAFPGAAVAIGMGSSIEKLQGYGHYSYRKQIHPITPYTDFDLASMTKVIATTTAAMQLYEDGRLALDSTVAHYLPDFAQRGKDQITIRQLLTHSSGLKPYIRPKKEGLHSRKQILDTVMAPKLKYTPGSKSVYSGLNMITLMRVIETITGQEFPTYCEQHIFKPLRMANTGFRPGGLTDTTNFAPTANHQRNVFQGVVNDPLARAMGGVSGNAGLFSTASDLSKFAFMLSHKGRIYGRQFLKPSTIELFTHRANVPNSTRALGWDTKTEEGYSSAGHLFGPRSFGHTGYTGTSIWFDPDQQLFAILLTNQVYPKGHHDAIFTVRSKFYDLVYSRLVGATNKPQ